MTSKAKSTYGRGGRKRVEAGVWISSREHGGTKRTCIWMVFLASSLTVCLLWVWGIETSRRTETSRVRPSDWEWGRAAPPATGIEEGALAAS